MSRHGCEDASVACITFSPVPPHRPRLCAAGRSGDFGRFRGETRNLSKAEDRGLLPSPLFPHSGAISAFSVRKRQTNTKRSGNRSFCLFQFRMFFPGCRFFWSPFVCCFCTRLTPCPAGHPPLPSTPDSYRERGKEKTHI